MATAPSFTGGKPSDHHQKMRNPIAHHLQQTSPQNNSPARTDLQNSEGITVHKNRLGASNISKANSGLPLQILKHGDCSPHQGVPPHQFSDNSTVGIVFSNEMKISGESELLTQHATGGQIEKERYQKIHHDENDGLEPSISPGYQPIVPILQSSIPGSSPSSGVQPNDSHSPGSIGRLQPIQHVSACPKEHVCTISCQSNAGRDHHDHRKSSELHHLAGHGAPGIIAAQNQCQSLFAPQEIVSQAGVSLINDPISSNIQKISSAIPSVTSDPIHNAGVLTETPNVCQSSQANSQGNLLPLQDSTTAPIASTDCEFDHSTVWAKQHMYIQGQLMELEAWTPAFKPNEDSPIVPIWVVIPELPWHLYYMEILTPLLSPIGKALYLDLASFQKTRGSVAKVKIQIDLTKERPHHVWLGYDEEEDENGDGEWLEVQYDSVPAYCTYCRHLGHSEFTCEIRTLDEEKKKRKEEGIKAGNSKAQNKDTPGTSKVTPVQTEQTGPSKNQRKEQAENPKVNSQDQRMANKQAEHQEGAEHQSAVAEISKEEWQTQKKKNFKGTTQAKRQQQVYIPKQVPTQHQQQVIPNDSQQLAPQSSGIPSINPPAQLERSDDSVAQNQPNPNVPPNIIPADSVAQNIPNPPVPPVSAVNVVDGGKVNGLESPIDRQEGVPKGEGVPHVLHECVSAQCDDHRMDLNTLATTKLNTITISDQTLHEERECEALSSEEDLPDKQNSELRRLAKGKAHAVSDFSLQPPKSRNKPISTMPRSPAQASADKSLVYKDPGTDPSLAQPLLDTNVQSRTSTSPIIQRDSATLAATPLEDCPSNKFSPEFDEYRPIQSEDEMSGGIEEEQEASDEASDDDRHYDLLVTAVNGQYQSQEVIDAQNLSPRTYNPAPRLTRSRAAGNTTAPPKPKKPSLF
ncbi:hypothetical protein A4A49_31318 [Nicotiana attenuata]|uniref:Uncharacterized protein n=1 Tax=Nicotiana attenuata TaxID=49451 RepID=A0A1J6IRU1_NICAT|nr:hypothetical protein A4A49_31318 [Nicotiana attenuata]